MSESKRQPLLSQRQRVAIWVIVGFLTLWIATYLVLRVGSARPDPMRPMATWINLGPGDFGESWQQNAPRFPDYSIAKREDSYSIVAPYSALPWCTVFHPLQKVDFMITGRRNYFIDPETARKKQGRIHIGATADF